MRKLTAGMLCLLPGLLLGQPGGPDEQRSWLLSQIRLGEAMQREVLVDDSLARLRLLGADDADVLAAAIRQAVRLREFDRATQLQEDLRRLAPDSPQERQMARLLQMSTGAGEQTLQQIRLLTVAGRFDEAMTSFATAFGPEEPPTLDLALEYWRIRSRLEGELPVAIARLQELEQQYPGSTELRRFLAESLLTARRDSEALDVLHRMAGDAHSRDQAADMEFTWLGKQAVSDASVAAWQAYIERYPTSTTLAEAREILASQRRLTDDPAWRGGRDAIALLDREGSPEQAERQLRSALAAYPDDATIKGYLGLALVRQSRRQEAIAILEQAVAEEQDTYILSKWHELLDSTGYWYRLEGAREAFDAGRYDDAGRLYQQAHQDDPREINAVLGLASVARQQGNLSSAEALFRQALQLDPDSDSALRGLLRLYEEQSPERVEAFLDSLPPHQQQVFAATRQALKLARLKAEADQALAREDWATATAMLRETLALTPDDPWLVYELARTLQTQDRADEADRHFADLLSRNGDLPDARYAHALHLSAGSRYQEGVDTLARIPQSAWSAGMHDLNAQLQGYISLDTARTLFADGEQDSAIALLEERLGTNTGNPIDYLAQLATWARERQEPARADAYYQRILTLDPQHAEARLGLVETLIDRRRLPAAREVLATAAPTPRADQHDARRRLANSWAAVGERDLALTQLMALAGERDEPDALLHRDLAMLLPRQNVSQALDHYALAMRDAGLLPAALAVPRDDIALARASRAQEGDDWLATSLRSNVDSLYQWQNPTLTVLQDYGWRNNDGTGGISDLSLATTMLHGELPVGAGRGFVRVERLDLSAGRFDADDDGLHRTQFGTCSLQGESASGLIAAGCPVGSQNTDGTSLALGWTGTNVAADIGLSAQGFEVDNLLGGISVNGNLAGVGWTLTGSRRPLTNSLLSYAGARDPLTGIRWGGVTATGATLGLSYDQGEEDGLWASLGYHEVRGENVADNSRARAMGGYYYRLINQTNEQLQIGANALYWSFDRDLGAYTLGHGGYYSPQRFVSVGIPFSYAWRDAAWSVYLEGALSYAWARSDAERVFPLEGMSGLMIGSYGPLFWSNMDQFYAASSASGIGYRAQALVERRLGDHWILGGGLIAQHSEDFAPSQLVLYLRYTFDPWQGNLPLSITPLQPYRDFR